MSETFENTFASLDLGSNSFHMKIARMIEQRLDIVDRLREQVQLAAGLDENKNLSEEAQTRALATSGAIRGASSRHSKEPSSGRGHQYAPSCS